MEASRAYHEVGHMVAAIIRDRKLVSMSLGHNREVRSFGRTVPTFHHWPPDNYEIDGVYREEAENPYPLDSVFLLAGGLAERRFRGGPYHQGHYGDWYRAFQCLGMDFVGSEEDRTNRWNRVELRMEEMLRAHWGAGEALAAALTERRHLTAQDAAAIARPALPAVPWDEICDGGRVREEAGATPQWFNTITAIRTNQAAPNPT